MIKKKKINSEKPFIYLLFFYELRGIPYTTFLVIIGRFLFEEDYFIWLYDFTDSFFLAKLNWHDYVTIARFQCHKMDTFYSISNRIKLG
jgi:hypothetical protein